MSAVRPRSLTRLVRAVWTSAHDAAIFPWGLKDDATKLHLADEIKHVGASSVAQFIIERLHGKRYMHDQFAVGAKVSAHGGVVYAHILRLRLSTSLQPFRRLIGRGSWTKCYVSRTWACSLGLIDTLQLETYYQHITATGS